MTSVCEQLLVGVEPDEAVSSLTLDLVAARSSRILRDESSRSWKASAIATMLTPSAALTAFIAAPVPRPPQPITPTRISSLPARRRRGCSECVIVPPMARLSPPSSISCVRAAPRASAPGVSSGTSRLCRTSSSSAARHRHRRRRHRAPLELLGHQARRVEDLVPGDDLAGVGGLAAHDRGERALGDALQLVDRLALADRRRSGRCAPARTGSTSLRFIATRRRRSAR